MSQRESIGLCRSTWEYSSISRLIGVTGIQGGGNVKFYLIFLPSTCQIIYLLDEMTVEHMVNMPSKANNDGFEQEPQFDYFGESRTSRLKETRMEEWRRKRRISSSSKRIDSLLKVKKSSLERQSSIANKVDGEVPKSNAPNSIPKH
ncbi:unnamed protein product, partial [Citrullus colocynthis]